MAPDESKVEELKRRVVMWYEAHGDKDLPWRRARSGWAVLVAAFLLRKTTARQVVRVYEEFLRKFPEPRALASASVEEVRDIIRPLGIEHQRARHLVELAEILVRRFGGRVPCDRERLKELPGVGDYIASEVLLKACGKPEPLLDRNVIRVLERALGVRSAKKRPHTDPAMWSLAKALTPQDPDLAEKFGFGLLDLARKLCRPARPQCGACPIKDLCISAQRATGL
mgnify:CR=1 FL=1